MIPIAIMVGLLSKGISTGHAISDMGNKPWLLFFFGVVLAPLVEEALFRLPLRYTPVNLTLPAFLWIFFIFGILGSAKLIPEILILPFLLLAVIGCLSLQIWLKQKVSPKQIHTFYEKWIGFFFYSSTIIFGLIHISNFQLINQQALLLAPLLVLPQLLVGFLLGFVRLQYGFWWCVLVHAFHNGYFLGQMLLSQSISRATSASQTAGDLINTPNLVNAIFGIFWLGLLFVCVIVVKKMVIEWRAESNVT